jgi:DNA-directed RNA polymerase subunit RPC12/RpoP
MSESDDKKVSHLPIRRRLASEKVLEVVTPYVCQHKHFDVDARLQEVECRDCKAKLNPMWVLVALSHEEHRLLDRWARLQAQIQSMSEKTRTKCKNCGKFTPIPTNAGYYELRDLAEQAKRGAPT